MSDDEPPRRSQRDRKQVDRYVGDGPSKKRKRTQVDSGSELTDLPSEPEDVPAGEEADDAGSDNDQEDADDEGDFANTPKAKGKAPAGPRKSKAATTTKAAKGPSAVKRPRTGKATGAPKAVKLPKVKGRRVNKNADGEFNLDKLTNETKIRGDNPLFNAVLNPSAALQSTAEEFLDSLNENPGLAQAELINCVLRACGSNDSVDADEVVDYDGVVDSLDTFTEGLKQENSPVYPLTSKLAVFKKFRSSLAELIERIVISAADTGALYTSDLIMTVQTWVVAMSSSQIRSFRHTATFVALEVESALCTVAAAVEKEAEIIGRQREGERKRKASNKTGAGGAGGVREKDLENKAAEVRKRREVLAEFLKEVVDGVFVHRYRDLDPTIRAECVRALGAWFGAYPAHFLDVSYLRYVGWVLSDTHTLVRTEAVRALQVVYAQSDYVGALAHFTERFKPRLAEMAARDAELGVRCAVLGVLGALDGHALLEDADRERLCLLVFDEEPRVRRAVAGFVRGVWEDAVEERLVGRRGKTDEKTRGRVGTKALAVLLVRWGVALERERSAAAGEDDEGGSVYSGEGGTSAPHRSAHVPPSVAADQAGRTALAVEALWDECEAVRDWEDTLDVLLLDHSAGGDGDEMDVEESLAGAAKKKGGVDEVWRLEDAEESVLLEVLVASIRRAKTLSATATKKGEEDKINTDITRALIKGLPRLFIKYQTDESRIADILLIPPLMNLDLYLEMRMMNAYAALWDDVTKQFLSHASSNVLAKACAALRHLSGATSLANTNGAKQLELEDELASQLRDAVAGREELAVASFGEDEVLALTAVCARAAALAGARDVAGWMEEDEGGKQSCVWDIVCALVERGRLGYKEEERMIEQGLHLLGLHIIWKTRKLPDAPAGELSADELKFREGLREQRDALVEKLVEYAVGTQSNTAEGVKRAAFQNLMHIHILFNPSNQNAAAAPGDARPLPTAALALELDDEVQYRCAGFIQATIEQFEEHFEESAVSERDEDSASGSGDDSDEDGAATAGKEKEKEKEGGKAKGKTKAKGRERERLASMLQTPSRARLQAEYVFMSVISTFLRAIRAGAVHIKHSAVLLAHHGRVSPSFDLCTRVVVDILREEGMYNEGGDVVVQVIEQALKESFSFVADNIVSTEEYTVGLAKQLAGAFLIRGAQLSVVRRLDARYVVRVHTDLLTWAIKRIAALEGSGNKNKRAKGVAVSFFRVLVPLLNSVESRDALKIKAHMDQLLAQNKLEVPPSAKMWEPQRAYEKRLQSAMNKDKARKGKKAGRAQVGAGTTTEEELTDGEVLSAPEEAPARPKPKPKRRRPRRRNDDDEDDEPAEEEEEAPSKPKSTLRARRSLRGRAAEEAQPEPELAEPATPRAGSAAPSSRLSELEEPEPTSTIEEGVEEEEEQEEIEDADELPTTNGHATPESSSRKRPRDGEDADEEEDIDEDDASQTRTRTPVPFDRELVIRRKRARH
ncbi:hypothetical protein CONPUDRAFT_106434 [Coniophora puteana RWD-64-598 SS2]|uniref:SCD domain-containing protein n=1 Tax=Coniophora puteana (strain RWD-64-598) TaxID=741705 RepID=A0A5M3MLB4_CONPW|nr:uncharacterized protein CONPUDRAFT_106434 [Coniophora puteana RWD-64-598 SS2]EIW79750.1 hypothetical protein CONPUDRAFT_106434 [Coniophora puteana RWD-64-598 SS2]